MKAMILAAGRGERMRPLTDTCPKPLLNVAGKPLIQHHIEALVNAGVDEIIINHAWLGHLIVERLGDGLQWRTKIVYSSEGETALETGGGIYKALPLLGKEPFIVVNGDIYTQMDYTTISLPESKLAHLVLVDNPSHNPNGDFSLVDQEVLSEGENKLTFSGIGLYHPDLFASCTPGSFPLAPILRQAMAQRRVSGVHFKGIWMDIGTPERLDEINTAFASKS